MDNQIKSILPFNGEGLILLGYRGSISHGTYIPKLIDDKDVMGIIIPPKEYMLGLKKYEQTKSFVGEWDIVIYEIRKFLRLLVENNPNVLNLLWNRENHYIYKTYLGQYLIDQRNLFLSKQCYKSFGGYAYGQLGRMTNSVFESYMGKKRKKLVGKFGYDCKTASHLIRLLKMGIEILTTGDVNVFREDAQLYIAIKQGEWTLDRVQNESGRLFDLLDKAYVRSKLPDKPDFDKINKLTVEIIEMYYDQKKS